MVRALVAGYALVLPLSRPVTWSLVHRAAAGDAAAREEFVRVHAEPLRAWLRLRWRASELSSEVEDAVQEVLLECLRPGGALERARPDRASVFSAYLLGVARNVARRFEERRGRHGAAGAQPPGSQVPAASDGRLSEAFDREWARSVVRAAGRVQERRAAQDGPEALRRVELLRLRFGEDLAVRAIAERWGEPPERVHREYARAREEFRRALLEVLADLNGGAPPSLEKEAARLLDLLE